MGLPVKFGKQTYEVQPQRIGRIRRKLGSAFSLIQDAAAGDTPQDLGGQIYEGLRVFVPDLADEWELLGYMSKDDYDHRNDEGFEESEYIPEKDGSPLTSEVEELLSAIYRINGGERLVKLLGKFVSEKTIQRQIQIMQASAVTKKVADGKDSPKSSTPSGDSSPPSSSTTSQSSQTRTLTPA